MAKLHFSLEGNSLGEYVLDKERMTIGRRPSNDIHIDNLAVSGEHAVIVTIGNDSFLEDLNSTNGTLVNSNPIKKHVLIHNDVITFGKYQLTYENKIQQKAPPSHGFENTVVVRPSKLVVSSALIQPKVQSIAPPELKPEAQAVVADISAEAIQENIVQAAEILMPASQSSDVRKSGLLEVLSGADSGNKWSLNKAMTTLGNPSEQVAVITKRPHGYFVTHVAGINLPIVNGQSIGTLAYALSDQDIIEVSGMKLKFFLD